MKKKKKEKLYIFVDSENVGNLIPEKIDKNTKIYFFFSDVNILKTIAPLIEEKRFETVNINEGEDPQKNEMDLCIIARMASLLHKLSGKKELKKARFVILSNDKGYDKAIQILRESFKTDRIEREGMTLRKFVEKTPDPYEDVPAFQGELPKDKALRKKAKKYRSWACYKKSLSTSQKKAIRIDYAFNKAGAPVWFEYDFYSGQYVLMYSGSVAGRFASRQDGQSEYSRLISMQKRGGQKNAAGSKSPQKNSGSSRNRQKYSRKNRNQKTAALSEPSVPDDYPMVIQTE